MSKIRIITIGSVLVIGLALMLILPFMQNQLDDFGYTSDLTPVTLKLGTQSFNIPKAYLWYKPNWVGKTDNAIHMTVTLPNYLPYSEDTKVFYKGGPGLKYKLAIDLFKNDSSTPPESIYFKAEALKNCEKKWGRYKVCPYLPQPGLFEVLVPENSDLPLAFVCPLVGTERSPFCKIQLSYNETIKLQLSMHEKQLMNADKIIPDVLSLLQKFSVPQQMMRDHGG
jgi:hypothetical protein